MTGVLPNSCTTASAVFCADDVPFAGSDSTTNFQPLYWSLVCSPLTSWRSDETFGFGLTAGCT